MGQLGNGEQITVGFLDIDDFRDYNTNYGHQLGDAVIQFVAKILQHDLRGQVGRNGGHGNVSGKRGRKKHLLYYGTIKEKYFEKRRFKIYACKT